MARCKQVAVSALLLFSCSAAWGADARRMADRFGTGETNRRKEWKGLADRLHRVDLVRLVHGTRA